MANDRAWLDRAPGAELTAALVAAFALTPLPAADAPGKKSCIQ